MTNSFAAAYSNVFQPLFQNTYPCKMSCPPNENRRAGPKIIRENPWFFREIRVLCKSVPTAGGISGSRHRKSRGTLRRAQFHRVRLHFRGGQGGRGAFGF